MFFCVSKNFYAKSVTYFPYSYFLYLNKIQNSFWTSIGQIVARMDKQGNCPKKARIYAIGIPVDWAGKFRNRAKKMKYGWDFLKLRIFLVDENGFVEEKTYKQFLKQ